MPHSAHRLRCSHFAVALIAVMSLGNAAGLGEVLYLQNMEEAFQRAKKDKLPIAIFFSADERIGHHQDHNRVDKAREPVRQALRSDLVGKLSGEIIILELTKNDAALRKRYKAKANEVVVVTSKGDALLTIKNADARIAQNLYDQLVTAIKKSDADAYKTDYQAKLTDSETKAATIRECLTWVRKRQFADADTDVASLLSRSNLDNTCREDVCKTLAALSTPAAVNALLDASATTPSAEKNLKACTKDALPTLLTALDDTPTDRFKLAYRAAAIISKLGAPKSDDWFDNGDQNAIRSEVARLRAHVSKSGGR